MYLKYTNISLIGIIKKLVKLKRRTRYWNPTMREIVLKEDMLYLKNYFERYVLNIKYHKVLNNDVYHKYNLLLLNPPKLYYLIHIITDRKNKLYLHYRSIDSTFICISFCL